MLIAPIQHDEWKKLAEKLRRLEKSDVERQSRLGELAADKGVGGEPDLGGRQQLFGASSDPLARALDGVSEGWLRMLWKLRRRRG